MVAFYTPNTIYTSREYSRIIAQMSMLAKCRLKQLQKQNLKYVKKKHTEHKFETFLFCMLLVLRTGLDSCVVQCNIAELLTQGVDSVV